MSDYFSVTIWVLASVMGALTGGAAADKFGRRPVIILGQVVTRSKEIIKMKMCAYMYLRV